MCPWWWSMAEDTRSLTQCTRVLRRSLHTPPSNLHWPIRVHNLYTQDTARHQAVHTSLNTGIEACKQAGVRAFIRCVFVSHTVRSAQVQ